jgi:hypothetical protein
MADEQSLLDHLVAFFDDEEWPHERIDGEDIVHLTFRSAHAEFDCYAQAIEADSLVLFYSRAPFDVPDDRRAAVAELLTRINDGLPIGNFEMSYETGAVRCKTSLDVPPGLLDHRWLQGVVGANLAVMEHHLPGVRAVSFVGADPARVAAELEI